MIWRNGELIAEGAAASPISASYGVFTTAGCSGGRPLLWQRHAARLAGSVDELQPDAVVTLPDEESLRELLAADGLGEAARLRTVARRDDARWIVEASASEVEAAGPDLEPVVLEIVTWPSAPPLAGHKTLARLAWDHAASQARRAGADDALLVDGHGRVLETSVANVLARFGSTVVTPPAPKRCLPGIMRGWLLEHLQQFGLEVRSADMDVQQLLAAEEVWVSNAVVGVCRVAGVGGASWSKWTAFGDLLSLGVPAPGWPSVTAGYDAAPGPGEQR